jgi:hypothetical protein
MMGGEAPYAARDVIATRPVSLPAASVAISRAGCKVATECAPKAASKTSGLAGVSDKPPTVYLKVRSGNVGRFIGGKKQHHTCYIERTTTAF